MGRQRKQLEEPQGGIYFGKVGNNFKEPLNAAYSLFVNHDILIPPNYIANKVVWAVLLIVIIKITIYQKNLKFQNTFLLHLRFYCFYK